MKPIIVAALAGAVYGLQVEAVAEADTAMYPFAMGPMPPFGQHPMGIPSPYPPTNAPYGGAFSIPPPSPA